MKRWAILLLFLLPHALLRAQAVVQTLVPQQPVTVGEAFSVQFVVYGVQQFQHLQQPDFGPHFKLVSGPAIHRGHVAKGGSNIPVQNFSYTLVPLRAGRLPVVGVTAVYNDRHQKAPDAFVVSRAKGSKDTQQSMAEAAPPLMVQTSVNKKECFVGEPITATFTLLSKVVTAAEVIKNPGFYGFSVVEMPLADATAESRYAGGYEKHLLRKLQLYPMQAGQLVIDEMTVHNTVPYTNEWGDGKEKEVLVTSAPVTINVKPLPEQKQQTYAGAVGRFAMTASLKRDKPAVGRTGQLQVTLSGAGNFIQLPMPEVHWPAHMEGFDPKVTEQLQKGAVPLAGHKKYEYSFTVDSAGAYTIPAIMLTYFDPHAATYRTIATDSLQLTVTPQKDFKAFFAPRKNNTNGRPFAWWWMGAAGSLLLFGWLYSRKKTQQAFTRKQQLNNVATDYTQQLKELTPSQKDFKAFYKEVQQIVLQLLKAHYAIAPTAKSTLQQQLANVPFAQHQKDTIAFILHECEQVQYYNALPQIPFTELQQKAIDVVTQLQPQMEKMKS